MWRLLQVVTVPSIGGSAVAFVFTPPIHAFVGIPSVHPFVGVPPNHAFGERCGRLNADRGSGGSDEPKVTQFSWVKAAITGVLVCS